MSVLNHIASGLLGSIAAIPIGVIAVFVMLRSLTDCGPGCAGGVGELVLFSFAAYLFIGVLSIPIFTYLSWRYGKAEILGFLPLVIDALLWFSPLSFVLTALFYSSGSPWGVTELYLSASPLLIALSGASLCWVKLNHQLTTHRTRAC